jgi:general secretion pathway protein D
MKWIRKCGAWRWGPVLAAALLLSGCVVDDRYLAEGRRHLAAGDWDQSVRFYQEALERYPGDPEVRLMLKGARWRSSLAHRARGEALLKQDRYSEAIAEFQMSLAMDSSNRKAAELIETARRRREAAIHLRAARNRLKARQFAAAREALDQALARDPGNPEALELLAYYERQEKDPPRYRLTLKNTDPISLKFKNTPVLNVFEILSTLTGVNFIFDRDVQDGRVTLFMTDVSFDRFIEVLLGTSGLAGKAVDEKTMIVYPDTPEKRKEYQDLQIRTFYLADIDAKTAVALLSKILNRQNIIANEPLNAVVVRAPQEVVNLASRIIEANDRPQAEVMLNVEILEASRTTIRNLGLDLNPDSVTLGIAEKETDADGGEPGFARRSSVDTLTSLSKEEILLSVPTATLNFLKQDGDTRTLASPQIRVRSGNPSRILIGERVPLRTNRRVDTTGVVTFDFQYFDVGVKLNATPTINPNGEITLDLKLEVSSLGPNLGTADDPQFSIRTRTAESILSIYDGESVIIGGLISDDERETFEEVPFLSDLPVVGKLFNNRDTNQTRTDIIMAITPVMLRDPQMPGIDVARVWSGPADRFSTETPYRSRVAEENRFGETPSEGILEAVERQEAPPPAPPASLPEALPPEPVPGEDAPAPTGRIRLPEMEVR